ncbi:hypothetical protein NI35_0937 [Salmonella enterica subsp. enterica serovar Cerro]|nr:hypothetical protein GW13_PRO1918 [Salmonella enterica subsp. enterica serovar Cerro]KMN26716.1 hypothetical protein NI35_0937 [Salmonella enterica subsp. enterica serovar Cerro]
MFPAPAGINRALRPEKLFTKCVPRASGDKPTRRRLAALTQVCSPRQRG